MLLQRPEGRSQPGRGPAWARSPCMEPAQRGQAPQTLVGLPTPGPSLLTTRPRWTQTLRGHRRTKKENRRTSQVRAFTALPRSLNVEVGCSSAWASPLASLPASRCPSLPGRGTMSCIQGCAQLHPSEAAGAAAWGWGEAGLPERGFGAVSRDRKSSA